MNPLLLDFNTAPFSKISNDDYKPAIKEAIEIAKSEIAENLLQDAKKELKKILLKLDKEKIKRIAKNK